MIKAVSLKSLNTFGIDQHAVQLVRIQDTLQLENLLPVAPEEVFILGGGSNLLLTRDIEVPVWRNEIKGIRIWKEDPDSVIVKIGGGERWHDLVEWAVAHDLGGIENLSLIPGTVGAAPIQNIGAYGVELADVFDHLEAYELGSGQKKLFENKDCGFAYRDSFFKREGKGRFFITHVYLRLKRPPHALSLEYGAILDTLKKMNTGRPDIRAVSQAVIAIRNSKLPDPLHIGNAGSFFKNPELPISYLDTLRSVVAEPIYYDLGNGRVKVPAGWLIEQCGWKGSRRGNVGCYDRQALVLVNYGNATGTELWDFAQDIQNSVKEKFGIELEPEVNVI